MLDVRIDAPELECRTVSLSAPVESSIRSWRSRQTSALQPAESMHSTTNIAMHSERKLMSSGWVDVEER